MEKNTEQIRWLEQVLKEEYQMVSVLKKNDTKEVLRLRNKHLGKDLVKKKFLGNGEVYRRLQQYEIPGVPMVYEAVSDGRQTVVLEEWINGISVGEILEQGLYREDGVRRVAKELCTSLSALHGLQIVHRDIKPEHVLITETGEVKLLDFDAARIHKLYGARDTVVLGTVGYAAPEQFGLSQTDCRADLYAMGVLMNVMLTGEHPSVRLCHGALRPVVERCIQTNPDSRFSSAEELRKAL